MEVRMTQTMKTNCNRPRALRRRSLVRSLTGLPMTKNSAGLPRRDHAAEMTAGVIPQGSSYANSWFSPFIMLAQLDGLEDLVGFKEKPRRGKRGFPNGRL